MHKRKRHSEKSKSVSSKGTSKLVIIIGMVVAIAIGGIAAYSATSPPAPSSSFSSFPLISLSLKLVG